MPAWSHGEMCSLCTFRGKNMNMKIFFPPKCFFFIFHTRVTVGEKNLISVLKILFLLLLFIYYNFFHLWQPFDEDYLNHLDPPVKHMSFHAYIRKLTGGADKWASLQGFDFTSENMGSSHPRKFCFKHSLLYTPPGAKFFLRLAVHHLYI